jgi:AcrR family transcriptional regulator
LSARLSARLPGTRLPAARRRRQLLDVALETFAERGFHRTSMNDIAEAAGVTKPVLYQHFRSKRALYLELVEDVGARLRDTIGRATSRASSPRAQVEAGFQAYFRFAADQNAAYQLLFGEGTRRDVEFAAAVRSVEISIAEIVADLITVPGLDTDRRRLLAHGVIGIAEGASRHWLLDGSAGDPDELARQTALLAWAGLRGVDPNRQG